MLRATLVQTQLQKSKTKVIEHILKLLNKVGSSGSDIVCLPELWYTKTVTNFEVEFAEIMDAAKEYNITIILGVFLEKVDYHEEDNNNNNNNNNNLVQISSPVIATGVIILGRQLKIHPFGSQRKVVKADTKVQVFESRNCKFGIGICYDIVFPEVARLLARKGAEYSFFLQE